MNDSIIKKPNFLGVGAMKGATTWLSECLRYHPEVFMSDLKEIHFFSNRWDKGTQWYFNHFQHVEDEKAIGEFSVSYFDDPQYCERIKEVLGPIKIIISLRDPIKRFISHYKFVYRNNKNAKNLSTEDINQDVLHIIKKDFPEVLTRGMYFRPVKDYIETFGAENVFVAFKEEIDVNPSEELKRLYRFLGVDDNFVPSVLDKQVSVGNIPKFYFLEKIRVKIYRFMKLNFPKGILWIRKMRIAEVYRKFNSKRAQLNIDPEVLQELKDFYSKDILLLEGLLEKDIESLWKIRST